MAHLLIYTSTACTIVCVGTGMILTIAMPPTEETRPTADEAQSTTRD